MNEWKEPTQSINQPIDQWESQIHTLTQSSELIHIELNLIKSTPLPIPFSLSLCMCWINQSINWPGNGGSIDRDTLSLLSLSHTHSHSIVSQLTLFCPPSPLLLPSSHWFNWMLWWGFGPICRPPYNNTKRPSIPFKLSPSMEKPSASFLTLSLWSLEFLYWLVSRAHTNQSISETAL